MIVQIKNKNKLYNLECVKYVHKDIPDFVCGREDRTSPEFWEGKTIWVVSFEHDNEDVIGLLQDCGMPEEHYDRYDFVGERPHSLDVQADWHYGLSNAVIDTVVFYDDKIDVYGRGAEKEKIIVALDPDGSIPCLAWPDIKNGKNIDYYKDKWYPRTVVEMEPEEAFQRAKNWTPKNNSLEE